ncbi:MBL fold metallo-hydrolase, partial [Nitratireductor sp. GCM10026969]
PGDAIVATEANAEAGLAAALRARLGEGFRFLFSSHVPAGTPAEALLQAGAAHWLGWNVHPRLEDVLDLADSCAAQRVVPVFLDVSEAPNLCAGLGDRLCLDRTIEV